jgi:PAS domain S-box-containing protein
MQQLSHAELLESLPSFWQAVLDSSHNGIVVLNRQGIILLCNRAARRVLNYSGPSPIGKPLSSLTPKAWPDLQAVIETGKPQIGTLLALPHTNIIANRMPIIIDGQVVGVISVFQDIAEYEAIISELEGYRKLHRELEAIIESSSDGLYVTDGHANTIRLNQAYERITGLRREELLGRNMKDLVKDGIFDKSVTLEVLKKRQSCTIMQSVLNNKQVMVTGNPFFDEMGEIALVITNVRDMTELNELRAKIEETRRLSSRYYEALLEQKQYEHVMEEMVVKSEPMMRVVQRSVKVARVETSVLLTGESGVGKSMLARIIHHMSPRKNQPLVKINCGTIPDSLMESELFGYEKGAFTGARSSGKAGLIEMAHKGTVFFDEIGDLKLDMQVKLLQIIEEKSFIRVGGTRPQSVDIRIIAASYHDLMELVAAGQFRNDLYYRLSVVPIHIPPLRDRKDDIPILVYKILEKFNQSMKLKKRIAPEVVDRLMNYHYPGNVRELINIMERMIILSDGEEITLGDLPGEFSHPMHKNLEDIKENTTLKDALDVLEERIIKRALNQHKSMSAAARALGLHPSTLCRKIIRIRSN